MVTDAMVRGPDAALTKARFHTWTPVIVAQGLRGVKTPGLFREDPYCV